MPEVFEPEGFRSGIALPARMDFQPSYLAALDARYPKGVARQVTVDSLPYSQYIDDNYLGNPLCQEEFMDRLSETPDLDLEAEVDR
jgi:hypothetical protein